MASTNRNTKVPARGDAVQDPSSDKVPQQSTEQKGAALWQSLGAVFAPIQEFFSAVGDHVFLAWRALKMIGKRPYRVANYIDAADYIGVGSFPIIVLVGAFMGMVTALQSVYIFRIFGVEQYVAGFTGKAISLELGPILTALILSGRVGAGIATEIGTMRITEQIDALESMAVQPIQFLVLPRLVAGFFMAPILGLIFFLVAMGGAYLVAVVFEGIDHGLFIANAIELLTPKDVVQGMIKTAIFGFVVSLIGCYRGYNASGGGRGVGIGTTRAVVISSVCILVLDYFLTDVLIAVFRIQG